MSSDVNLLSCAVGENSGRATVDIAVRSVPEPATFLLLGIGLMGLAKVRKKLSW